jgi:hypothetical protein
MGSNDDLTRLIFVESVWLPHADQVVQIGNSISSTGRLSVSKRSAFSAAKRAYLNESHVLPEPGSATTTRT